MGLEQMDAAAGKIRRALAVVALLEAGAQQVTREEIMEAVAILRDHLQEAGSALEEAYARRQKPGHAPALFPSRSTVANLVPNSRPAQTPA